MKIKFWGVNGSIASPCDSEQIESKVREVLWALKPDDLKNESSREKFFNSLPHRLKGTYKGNTSCVQVVSSDQTQLILDSGTGVRKLALELMKTPLGRGQGEVHILYSHLHWDHIQGFPFFVPAYIPGNQIHIYGRIDSLEEKFRAQLSHPYFPLLFDQLGATIHFHELEKEQEILIKNEIKVQTEMLYHPQVSHAYSVEEQGKKVVYMTDSEFHLEDMQLIQNAIELCKGADVFIFDCQFTFHDAISKVDWGHSSIFTGIDIASSAGAKRLYLFHHEPAYDDTKIESLLEEGFKYREKAGNKDLELIAAYDGLEVKL
ncbi:MBL fold metallo-hydrolase [bacterium]|nr:MBL fold metallo-hydrolase [bacterium]